MIFFFEKLVQLEIMKTRFSILKCSKISCDLPLVRFIFPPFPVILPTILHHWFSVTNYLFFQPVPFLNINNMS